MIAKNFLEEILLSPLKSIERYIIIVSVGFVCDKSETSFPRVYYFLVRGIAEAMRGDGSRCKTKF